jgi:CheY-like chemotaxis protein
MTRTILIADDEAGFRDLFAFALEPLGWRVTVVCDGAEAIAQAAMRAFDLVVLDQHMPRMNGLDALEQIRRLLPGMPVLMMSGSSEDPVAFETEVLARGAACCLFKPLELTALIEAVERHAAGRF